MVGIHDLTHDEAGSKIADARERLRAKRGLHFETLLSDAYGDLYERCDRRGSGESNSTTFARTKKT
jgi:hypothetical protein